MLFATSLGITSRQLARSELHQIALIASTSSTSPAPARTLSPNQTRPQSQSQPRTGSSTPIQSSSPSRTFSTMSKVRSNSQSVAPSQPATTKATMAANQDTAFDADHMGFQNLRGLLPPTPQPMATQVQRCLQQLRAKDDDLEKHIYLAGLRQSNARLFYSVVMTEMQECLPLVYTPTVGKACQQFSHIYRRPEGLTLTIEDKGRVAQVLNNWPVPGDDPTIAVLTDGSRILGLGDLGWNGMGICIGKLSLYVAAAGIHPRSTIPICVDLGTNNKENLEDPLYLGLRQKRVSDAEYREFLDEVMDALHKRFPHLIIQYEDFSTEHAFEYLERYQSKYPMFNDDIQGTGAVVLGGAISAFRAGSKASKRPLSDQRILFFGAGSAGVGVAKQLMAFFKVQGLSEEEARRRIWLVDSKGLVTNDRGDRLPEHKVYFSRDDNKGKQYKSLVDVIDYVQPTALIGLSTVPKTFDEAVLRKMASINARPIVLPLSNPSSLSECTHEEAIKHTDGTAIFAAGSPFPDVEHKGKTFIAGQANNLYVFPGIGLGGDLCKASRITPEMVTSAAFALANSLTKEEEESQGRIYPSLLRIREVSKSVAKGVIRKAIEQKVTRDDGYTANLTDEELEEWIEKRMWVPEEDPLIRES